MPHVDFMSLENCLGFDPWVGKIPWRRERLPFQYSGLENSMYCIVHGVAESDMTERLSLSLSCNTEEKKEYENNFEEKSHNYLL